jgi:hypothetical protein
MKLLFVTMLALSAAGLVADDTKLGNGVTLKEATPIAAILKAPGDYAGKAVRIDGVATAVCQEMGCWMAVADSDKTDAPTIRLKVEHEGAIVFPMSAKGKQVSAEGTFESIGGASAQYQIKATGAVIKIK